LTCYSRTSFNPIIRTLVKIPQSQRAEWTDSCKKKVVQQGQNIRKLFKRHHGTRKVTVQCGDSTEKALRIYKAELTHDKATREKNMHYKVTS